MAQSEQALRDRAADVVRARIRMQAAALGLTHERIAERMTRAGRHLLKDPGYRVSPAKVSHVARGSAFVQLEDIEIWAAALETIHRWNAARRLINVRIGSD